MIRIVIRFCSVVPVWFCFHIVKRGDSCRGENVAYTRIPVRTHLITGRDDIVEVVAKYTGKVLKPRDVVVICESPVAISQGRAIPSARVRPGLMSRILCKFPKKHGSLATPQAMQLAIREAGLARVLLGAAAGLVGKLMRKPGYFFVVAGHGLATIDDVAGTIPPYDECIVLGPKDPQKVAERIAERIGAQVVIADVNDLRKVDVLGITEGLKVEEIKKALEDNPSGNDDEKTPIVVLRPQVDGEL